MKKILLVLLASPILSFGQHLDVSVLFGLAGHLTKSANFSRPTSLTTFRSLQVSYHIKKVELGIKSDLYKLSYSNEERGQSFIDNSTTHMDFTLKFSPAVNLSAFANYKVRANYLVFYFGPNAGYLVSAKQTLKMSIGENEYPTTKLKGNFSGLTLGLQAGVSYELWKNTIVKAECSPRYYYSVRTYSQRDYDHRYNAFSLPITIGVTARF